MSDSDSDHAEIPSREICENRSQEFASLTNTDSALAFFFLQRNQWNLEKAVDAFFGESETQTEVKPKESANKGTSDIKGAVLGASSQANDLSAYDQLNSSNSSNTPIRGPSTGSGGGDVDPMPHRIRVLSWNIDGLDQRSLDARTKAVCSTINQEKPDVVFLQEVIPQTLHMIEDLCPTFQVIPGDSEGYFTAMLLSITSVEYEKHDVKQFDSSLMNRNILSCKGKVKGVPMTLMTSHLESTAEHAQERTKQLKMMMKDMEASPAPCTVLAGGDFNLRDKEIAEMGGLPGTVLDVWEVTGKRPEAKFTWDLMRNDNLEWTRKFKPRCRFDRMFMRHPGQGYKLKPVYFELVGLERIKNCGRFPSDHWGILAHFNKV